MRFGLVAAAMLVLMAPAADARTETVSRQGVVATIAMHHERGSYGHVVDRLTISRAGEELFSGKPRPKACRPYGCAAYPGTRGLKPLRIRDVQGDGEPEVIYTSFWGGAHCCTIAEVYSLQGDTYEPVSYNFTDTGFHLRDLDSDGTTDWVSRDPAFDYAFTAYAFSGKPIQVFHFNGRRFVDATRSFPERIRRDARLWRHYYLKTRHRTDGVEYGAVAAWAADRYLLGRRDATLRFLHREAKAGLLQPRGGRFVFKLDGFLLRHGYG